MREGSHECLDRSDRPSRDVRQVDECDGQGDGERAWAWARARARARRRRTRRSAAGQDEGETGIGDQKERLVDGRPGQEFGGQV